MSRVYSSDLRVRVLRAIEHGQFARAAATRRPGKKSDHGSKLDAHAGFIRTQIVRQRDLTLAELALRLEDERGVQASLATVCRFLRRQGSRLKKTAHAIEQQRPDVAHARQVWIDQQMIFDPARLVFIDETAATSTAMARAYGRAERGVRCATGVPCGHWQTTTFVGGLRHHGIVAPMVLDGAMNGALFRAIPTDAGARTGAR